MRASPTFSFVGKRSMNSRALLANDSAASRTCFWNPATSSAFGSRVRQSSGGLNVSCTFSHFRPRLRRIIGKRAPTRLLFLRKGWWLRHEESRGEEQEVDVAYRAHFSNLPPNVKYSLPTGANCH